MSSWLCLFKVELQNNLGMLNLGAFILLVIK